MKSLKDHTLVYDSECPMCDLYTRGFIKTGMLDSNGRVAYGNARVPASFSNDRARNEIALIDYKNGSVTYGLDSLIKIIGHSFPFAGTILTSALIHAPLSFLYSLISYNRKVIAPPKDFEKRGACTPSYKAGYRIAYIVFAWLITSIVLTKYSTLLTAFVPKTSYLREFVICGGQIIFQMAVVLFMMREKLLHYIGNMMTVSVIGALLLLPVLTLSHVVNIHPAVSLAWFALVVMFMLFIHYKRVKVLGLPVWVTVGWVCYRLLVLCIIIP